MAVRPDFHDSRTGDEATLQASVDLMVLHPGTQGAPLHSIRPFALFLAIDRCHPSNLATPKASFYAAIPLDRPHHPHLVVLAHPIHIADRPNHLLMQLNWFKQRGILFTPITLIGWLIALAALILTGYIAIEIDARQHSVSDFLINFTFNLLLIGAGYTTIAYLTSKHNP